MCSSPGLTHLWSFQLHFTVGVPPSLVGFVYHGLATSVVRGSHRHGTHGCGTLACYADQIKHVGQTGTGSVTLACALNTVNNPFDVGTDKLGVHIPGTACQCIDGCHLYNRGFVTLCCVEVRSMLDNGCLHQVKPLPWSLMHPWLPCASRFWLRKQV